MLSSCYGDAPRPGTLPGVCAIMFGLPGEAGALDHKKQE
jgi:hypothetical protein